MAPNKTGDTGAAPACQQVNNPSDVIDLEANNVRERDDEATDVPDGKRHKKCTSAAWDHFTKYIKSVQVDGKIVKQEWAKCKYCPYEAHRKGRNGTSVFLSHTKSQHSKLAGQQQLKVEKNESGLSSVEPYRYDLEVSLRKFYLAIIMHEYPCRA
ncbi:Unknown protein [Striga hermonthica]|uniref:BED-type domain-containing protein n=1 Tax=Striga hermonthica TaxID=68872 RepID=A0A9N7NHV7_STRHE|nr:Unknown protein [Striga hermonthica]